MRRAFHTLVAVAGWVLFVYWWWLVSRSVGQHEIRFTLFVLAIALTAILLLTAIWVLHNIQIFRARGPRLHMRSVVQDYSLDTVGRNVRFPEVPADCLSAAIVNVQIRDGVKVYAPGPAKGSPSVPGTERR